MQTLARQAAFFALLCGYFPLMPSLRLTQNGREAAAAEAESLFYVSGHGDFSSGAWHAVALAVDPHSSGIIVQFKNPGAKRAEGIGYSSGNRDLFASIASGIAIDFFNARAGWASGQEQCCNR
jgi:hypothetical protein